MRKRIYSESEVRHIFILSESRASPVTGETGHSGRDHNTISNRSLELRDTGAGYATAFVGGFKDQIRAATALLNSSDGQDRLGELDDRGSGARVRISGDVVPPLAIRYGMGLETSRVLPARAVASTRVRMIVDATEDGIHIQTIFPLLPGNYD